MHRHRKDLKAVLLFDPENAEAKALLSSRSLAVEQVRSLSPTLYLAAYTFIPSFYQTVKQRLEAHQATYPGSWNGSRWRYGGRSPYSCLDET